MESSNQVAGAIATASAYNLLRTDVIANISSVYDASTAASAAAADLDAHEAASVNLHGLGSGIDVLGAASPGLYVQYISVAATVRHTDGGNSETRTIFGTWPQAFTNIYACTVSCGLAHSWSTAEVGIIENIRHIAYNTTAVTVTVRTFNADAAWGKIPLRAIGIGK